MALRVKLFNIFKNSLFMVSSFMFLMSGPMSYIVTAESCDPNDPTYLAKQSERAINDILYFDNCVVTCSTGADGGAGGIGVNSASLQKVIDEAVKAGKDKGVDVQIVVSGDAQASGGELLVVPSASVIKLLVAASLSDQGIPLSSVIGDLTPMIRDSNNEAANRLIDRAGGFGAINATAAKLAADAHIGRKMLASTIGGDPNTISAKGSDTILTAIKDGTGLIKKDYSDAIINAMKAQTVNTKWGASGIPKENMAHKTGELNGAQHDVGYFINGDKWLTVSILTNQTSGNGSEGVTIVKDTAKKLYDAWGGGSGSMPSSNNSAASCCSTGGSSLNGDNNAEKVYNYMINLGYTPEQAAGITGNMILESYGVRPMQWQKAALGTATPWDQVKNPSSNAGGNAYGISQWDPPNKVIDGVKARGGDPNTLDDQLAYLTGDGGFTGGARDPKTAADKVKEAQTVDQATVAYMTYFEAPGVPHLEQRLAYANAIYNKATKGEPYPPEVDKLINWEDNPGPSGSDGGAGALSTGSSTTGCKTSDNGECKNPFRDLEGSGPLRIDGGVDYGGASGKGPVYPVCPAKVVNVYPTTSVSGWPGIPGSYITYEITSGKAKGLFAYIAEDCAPLVKPGDEISVDSPICQYEQKEAYLEIGWSNGGNNAYIEWSDYKEGGAGSYASNSGQDMSKFLESLGAEPGLVQGPLSTKPVPEDWPKW